MFCAVSSGPERSTTRFAALGGMAAASRPPTPSCWAIDSSSRCRCSVTTPSPVETFGPPPSSTLSRLSWAWRFASAQSPCTRGFSSARSAARPASSRRPLAAGPARGGGAGGRRAGGGGGGGRGGGGGADLALDVDVGVELVDQERRELLAD